jgi:hypothetical protein
MTDPLPILRVERGNGLKCLKITLGERVDNALSQDGNPSQNCLDPLVPWTLTCLMGFMKSCFHRGCIPRSNGKQNSRLRPNLDEIFARRPAPGHSLLSELANPVPSSTFANISAEQSATRSSRVLLIFGGASRISQIRHGEA